MTSHRIPRVFPVPLVLVLFLLLPTGDLLGQGGTDNIKRITISASADVLANIRIVSMKDLQIDMGDIDQSEAIIDPGVNPHAAKLKVTGSPGVAVKVVFDKMAAMVHESGESVLDFYYHIHGNDEDKQSGSEELFSGDPVVIGKSGEYFVWIGGRVNLSGMLAGNYAADFLIEFEYF